MSKELERATAIHQSITYWKNLAEEAVAERDQLRAENAGLINALIELRRNVIPLSEEARRRYNEMETAQRKHSDDLAALAIAKMNAENDVQTLSEALTKCNRLRSRLESALPYETLKAIYASELSQEPEKPQPST